MGARVCVHDVQMSVSASVPVSDVEGTDCTPSTVVDTDCTPTSVVGKDCTPASVLGGAD